MGRSVSCGKGIRRTARDLHAGVGTVLRVKAEMVVRVDTAPATMRLGQSPQRVWPIKLPWPQ